MCEALVDSERRSLDLPCSEPAVLEEDARRDVCLARVFGFWASV